jgi:hypothetical protein
MFGGHTCNLCNGTGQGGEIIEDDPPAGSGTGKTPTVAARPNPAAPAGTFRPADPARITRRSRRIIDRTR